MKPVQFAYERPGSLDETLRLLAEHAGRARLLAGGQSLGPMLNLRLAAPDMIIDIGRLQELQRVELAEGVLIIGAGVCHADIEDGRVPDVTHGLLGRVASGIGYRAVRNRGTVGGSLAHADPAADWPPVLMALGAELDLRSTRQCRRIAAAALVRGLLTTTLEADEIIETVCIPRAGGGMRWGHYKISAKPGDFADSLAVVVIDRDKGEARAVLAGRSQTPVFLPETAHAVAGIHSWSSDRMPVLSAAMDADLGRLGFSGVLSQHDRAIHFASVARAAREAVTR